MVLLKVISILLAISSIIAAPPNISEGIIAATPVIPPADAVTNQSNVSIDEAPKSNETESKIKELPNATFTDSELDYKILTFVEEADMQDRLSKLYVESKKKDFFMKVIGGGAAEPGQFPHQALLFIEKEPQKRFLCGGSLIRHNWILTAAHCFHSDFYSAEARLGTALLKGPAVFFTPITRENIVIHPDYDHSVLRNDIALIHLARAPSTLLSSPYVDVIELPNESDNDKIDKRLGTILGFGRISDKVRSVSNKLNYNILRALPNEMCEPYYPEGNIRDTNICAETSASAATCEGDSGGPYTFYINRREILGGITSFGATDGCQLGYPVAFTRVSKYLDWIYGVVGNDTENAQQSEASNAD